MTDSVLNKSHNARETLEYHGVLYNILERWSPVVYQKAEQKQRLVVNAAQYLIVFVIMQKALQYALRRPVVRNCCTKEPFRILKRCL